MPPRKKPPPLPLEEVWAGDVFLMPLRDGRLGACRVVRVRKDKNSGRQALVSASPWVGTAPPDLSEPLLCRVLVLTHHSWKGVPEILWVDAPVPGEFTRLGRLTGVEGPQGEAHGGGHWVHFPMQVLMQWRWDHEREVVQAEDRAEQQQREAATLEYAHSYKPLLPHPLERLRTKKYSPGGEGYAEPQVLRAVRRVLRELIDGLIALGPEAPVPLQLNLFHWATEQFNELDDGWIETMTREDLCEILENIAAAAGLDGYDEALHARREW